MLIKDRVKGVLVADVNYSDFSVASAALITYWSNKASATTGNPKGKFYEIIDLNDLSLVRITDYAENNEKVYAWVFVVTYGDGESPHIIMLSGKARIQSIGVGKEKKEIAKSMTGYVLGDSTEAGEEIGQMRMGKVAVQLDTKLTGIANSDPNYGGFGGNLHDFVSGVDAKRGSVSLYFRQRGYVCVGGVGMLDAPQWVDVNDSNSNAVFFDWTDVNGAKKYSFEVEGTVTYFDPNTQTRVQVEVELDFDADDRIDGGSKSDSDLTLSGSELNYAVVRALYRHGVDPRILRQLDAWRLIGRAKVKALNPGKGSGRQNHPFSEWSEEFEVIWHSDD
jgi:hypothetical protein